LYVCTDTTGNNSTGGNDNANTTTQAGVYLDSSWLSAPIYFKYGVTAIGTLERQPMLSSFTLWSPTMHGTPKNAQSIGLLLNKSYLTFVAVWLSSSVYRSQSAIFTWQVRWATYFVKFS